MALWFAGASTQNAPMEFRAQSHATGKVHTAQKVQSHLDVATLSPTNSARPHGKRRTDTDVGGYMSPRRTEGVDKLLFYDEGVSGGQRTPPPSRYEEIRRSVLATHGSHLNADLQPTEPIRPTGVRVFRTPQKNIPTAGTPILPNTGGGVQYQAAAQPYYSPAGGAAAAATPAPAPFASDVNNTPAVPYVGMKRKIDEPRVEHKHDGDAFLLRRSRTPPAGAKYQQSTAEGFGVLLASSLKSRANPQMVPSSRYGKLAAQKAEEVILERRKQQEVMIEQAVKEKSARAFDEERRRMALHEQQPQRSSGRGRIATPVSGTDCPFALNFPVPRDTVGMRSSAINTPRKWVR